MSNVRFCVGGMHAGGTSMISKILYFSGVCMGNPRRFSGCDAEGKTDFSGQVEDTCFVDLNNRILRTIGATWDSGLPKNNQWIEEFPDKTAMRLAAHWLVKEFDCAPVFGFKDPRNCVTFPFWKEVIDYPRVVICLRHPADVKASLFRREAGRLSKEQCSRLWSESFRLLLDSTKNVARLVCDRDRMFAEPEHEIRRLLRFVEADASPTNVAAGRSAIDQKLSHISSGNCDRSETEPAERELYDQLHAESTISDPLTCRAGHS